MHVKAMVVFQGASNTPEDRFVNTLHFLGTWASKAAAQAEIAPAVTAFYNGPTLVGSIGSYLPAWISRTAQLRLYDLAEPIQRVPELSTFTLGTPTAGDPLPEEVAIVCSFHGAPPVTKRSRGRIFLGPLSSSVSSGDSSSPSRVTASMRTKVTNAAKALADANVGWVIYSPTDDVTRSVEGGFCDNAFDTMRKRGPKTTARTTWVAA